MKRFLSFAAGLAVAAAAAAAPLSAQAVKIGYVDFEKLSQQAPGVAEAQKTLQTEGQKYQTELQHLGTQLDSLQTAFQKQQSTLTATAKQQREQEFQQRLTAAQQREQQIQQAMQQRQEQLLGPIQKQVLDTVEALRKEGGYAMILGKQGSGIIAADPALDLTDQVLQRLGATKPTGK
jgi:outer membrane protein